MCAKIIDIANVPPSPNTGYMPIMVFNPLNEDFTHPWDGKPYTIPAGKSVSYPEFLARHLAKHLAKKIVSKKWDFEIKKDAVGQITPDTAKAIPLVEVQKMMEALLKGESAFEKMNTTILEVKIGEPTLKVEEVKIEAKIEEPKVVEEEKKEEVNPLKCSVCGFVAKSKLGLSAHIRFKHSQ